MDGIRISQSNDHPIAPLFLCDNDEDWIELETKVEIETKLFRPGSAKKYDFIAYATNQTRWRMRYESPAFSDGMTAAAITSTNSAGYF